MPQATIDIQEDSLNDKIEKLSKKWSISKNATILRMLREYSEKQGDKK